MAMTRGLALVLACALLSMAGPRAQAGLTAYDSFSDTPVGAPLIATSNSGTGFTGPWHPGGFNASIFANYTIANGSLSDGSLLTAGNSVSTAAQQAISGLSRDLATPLGAAGTTAYLSVLLRPEGVLDAGAFGGFFGLYLNASTNAPGVSNDVFIGKPGTSDAYVVEDRGGTNRHLTNATATVGQTVLLVLRADFTSGIDRFTLYVNPTPGGAEPLSGTVKQDSDVGTISSLTLYSTGAFSVDEIRIGTTFADVVPAAVPEPSSLVLVALGGIGAFGAARMRTSRRRLKS